MLVHQLEVDYLAIHNNKSHFLVHQHNKLIYLDLHNLMPVHQLAVVYLELSRNSKQIYLEIRLDLILLLQVLLFLLIFKIFLTLVGTTVKFIPITGNDTMVKGGEQRTIATKNMCITAMQQYESKSLEVLIFF